MKIALFSDLLMPPSGGVEIHVLLLAQALLRLGHVVKVFAPVKRSLLTSRWQPWIPDGVLHALPSVSMTFVWPNFQFAFPTQIINIFKSWHPDVIHVHSCGPTGVAAIIAAKLLNIRLLSTFHSLLMTEEYLSNNKLFRNRTIRKRASDLLWFYIRTLYNQCDAVVSPSEWAAKELRHNGITSPVHVIANGIPLEKFSIRAQKSTIRYFRKKWKLADPTFLYIGRLSVEKNIDELLRSFRRVLDKSPDCFMVLVGDGDEINKLKTMTRDMKMEKRVRFVGRIEHDDLPISGVFEVSRAFVTASSSENNPISILEAMAKGLPILGVYARGMSELVTQNGLLAPSHDARGFSKNMLEFLADPARQKRMIAASRKKSLQYSVETMVGKLEKLYVL